MAQFVQLLIGSSFVAGVAFLSWLVGLLMGVVVTAALAKTRTGRSDIDELLKRERATAVRQSGTAVAGAPGTSTAGRVG